MHSKGSTQRLSGFSAHTKPGEYGGIEFNGRAGFMCETFSLREHFKLNFKDTDLSVNGVPQGEYQGFNFCKTRQYPYDVVVTACLAVLKQRLGSAVNVSSDGEIDDFQAGVELARRILKRRISNPLGEAFTDKFERIVNK